MQSQTLSGNDRSMTHPSLDIFDADHADSEQARHLAACLNRNDTVPTMRQYIALAADNKKARKRIIAIAKTNAFGEAWSQSVQSTIAPAVHAIWQAWGQQRGTERERMKRLRQLFRAVNQLRACFPLEVARDHGH